MFESRSTESEFIDRPDCDPALAAAGYRFMERVNSLFGGIRIVKQFLASESVNDKIAEDNGVPVRSSAFRRSAGRPPKGGTTNKGRPGDTPLRILDIGSGSCDIPLAISRWGRAHGIPLHITCLEMANHAIDIARAKLAQAGDPAIQLLQEDAFTHQPAQDYDCAMASMCFHHFTDAQILTLLQRLRGFVRHRVLINDLRRSRWASLAARLLLIGWPAGVLHDALLSIRRGFKPRELKNLLSRIPGVTVSVKPAPWFRIAAIIQFKRGDNT